MRMTTRIRRIRSRIRLAKQILGTGFTAQSPVGKANEIKAVANHLSQVLTQIQSKNDTEIAQAKEMVHWKPTRRSGRSSST